MAQSSFLHSAQAYLLRAGDDGRSVYDKLCEFTEALLASPQDFERFGGQLEDVLHHTEAGRLKPNVTADRQVPSREAQSDARTRRACQQKLAKQAKLQLAQEVQDLAADARLLDMAGVGLSAEEATVVGASMAHLAAKHQLSSVRFFGKLLGTQAAYYVCESSYHPTPEDGAHADDPDALKPFELRATELPPDAARFGANKLSYWVCNNPGDEWVRLPNVTPAQIGASKHIRKLLTGRLEAVLHCHPPFPGNEANYLRALIARIAAATVVAPAGFYSVVEQEEDDDDEAAKAARVPQGPQLAAAEEFAGIEGDELASLASWVHVQHFLLASQHRGTKWTKPVKEEEEDGGDEPKDEDEEEEPEEENPEEEKPLLESIEGDAPLLTYTVPAEDGEGDPEERTVPRWAVAQPGKKSLGALAPVVLRNLRWPGAVSFAASRGMRFGNIYIGNGLPYLADAFTPALVGDLRVESADVVMQAEPRFRAEEKLLTDTLSEAEDPEFQ